MPVPIRIPTQPAPAPEPEPKPVRGRGATTTARARASSVSRAQRPVEVPPRPHVYEPEDDDEEEEQSEPQEDDYSPPPPAPIATVPTKMTPRRKSSSEDLTGLRLESSRKALQKSILSAKSRARGLPRTPASTYNPRASTMAAWDGIAASNGKTSVGSGSIGWPTPAPAMPEQSFHDLEEASDAVHASSSSGSLAPPSFNQPRETTMRQIIIGLFALLFAAIAMIISASQPPTPTDTPTNMFAFSMSSPLFMGVLGVIAGMLLVERLP